MAGAQFRSEFSRQPIGPNRVSAEIIEALAELIIVDPGHPTTLRSAVPSRSEVRARNDRGDNQEVYNRNLVQLDLLGGRQMHRTSPQLANSSHLNTSGYQFVGSA